MQQQSKGPAEKWLDKLLTFDGITSILYPDYEPKTTPSNEVGESDSDNEQRSENERTESK